MFLDQVFNQFFIFYFSIFSTTFPLIPFGHFCFEFDPYKASTLRPFILMMLYLLVVHPVSSSIIYSIYTFSKQHLRLIRSKNKTTSNRQTNVLRFPGLIEYHDVKPFQDYLNNTNNFSFRVLQIFRYIQIGLKIN